MLQKGAAQRSDRAVPRIACLGKGSQQGNTPESAITPLSSTIPSSHSRRRSRDARLGMTVIDGPVSKIPIGQLPWGTT